MSSTSFRLSTLEKLKVYRTSTNLHDRKRTVNRNQFLNKPGICSNVFRARRVLSEVRKGLLLSTRLSQRLGRYLSIAGFFIPTASAPTMLCLTLLRCIFGCAGQPFCYFALFLVQLLPKKQPFVSTLWAFIAAHCHSIERKLKFVLFTQHPFVSGANLAHPLCQNLM